MTTTRKENSYFLMLQDEMREAASAVVFRIPQLVPDEPMEFGEWQAWAKPVLMANEGQYDEEYLPYMHEAVQAAIFNRTTFDAWPSFTRAMRQMIPDMAPDAVVYDVEADDGGRDIKCPNTILRAGRISNGQLHGDIWEKTVSKDWLRAFCLEDEIAQAKKEIGKDDLELVEAAGWSVGHDPKGQILGVMLIHDDLDRIWPIDDLAGAMADIGMSAEAETETPEP